MSGRRCEKRMMESGENVSFYTAFLAHIGSRVAIMALESCK